MSGLLVAGSLAVTTACGLAVDEGSGTAAGPSAVSGSTGGSTGTGSSDTSGSTGTRLAPGSTTVTHATSQGS